MYIRLDKDYEIKTTLGTIRDIERVFGKSFFEVVNSISGMNVEDQLKLLYIGARKANTDLSEENFYVLCENYLGIGDLMECLEKYFYALQYPGLSEQEVQDKIKKKLQKSQQLKADMASIG
ncbi:MAG: hypothetical protein ACLSUT_08335 [Christensenellales bacterium]|nr:MAG TPA: tail assembly chaperone protein [Bacteriophage sp.]DAP31306.1 MAG TPA: tail assembly chaperone protein [Caudoviricetes sp.]